MKREFRIGIVSGLLACVSLLMCPVHHRAVYAQSAAEPWSFSEDSIRSGRLGEAVRLRVALPLEYNPDRPSNERFPVLIVTGASDRMAFASTVASLRLLNGPFGGPIPPLIIVGVASDPVSPWPRSTPALDSLRPNAGGADAFVHFLQEDLLPWIKKRLPALPYTVLAGHSRYGLLSLYALSKAPSAFNAAVAVSPALWWLSDQANDSEFAQAWADSVTRHGSRRVYLGIGEFDPLPIRKGTGEFVNTLRRSGVRSLQLKYQELSDDHHQTSRQRGFVEGVRWVFEPISLARNPVYALMGGYARDLDSLALRRAYLETKARYAAGARSLGLPEALPSRYLETMIGLPPIDRREDPIPIFRLLCDDLSGWYPKRSSPQICSR